MSGYDGRGIEDDLVAQAARRIVRQYHLEQSDRSEDSISLIAPPSASAGQPDNVHALRLALDGMATKIEHLERFMANREALFMAALERVERNLAKTDGALDALASQLSKMASAAPIDRESAREEQRIASIALAEEFSGMMALGRALLEEVRDLHGVKLLAAASAEKGSSEQS